jgi:acetyl-CoA C-acetyltransferase
MRAHGLKPLEKIRGFTATGVRLTLTCPKTLHRDNQQLGIASACIGGGQGIAMVVEAC